jgi:hypothetical protein
MNFYDAPLNFIFITHLLRQTSLNPVDSYNLRYGKLIIVLYLYDRYFYYV